MRFGVFEADLETRELRKQGRRIRLQDQPFALLAFLLERPGVIVSREELRDKLWPADTFVDFDHSLNTAVNKIREVLGDSAVTRILFGLLQVMYLIFYVEALLHWHALDRIEIFNVGAPLVTSIVIVSTGVGIPLRFYLLSAVGFDHAQLGMKFHKIFLGILVFDLFWGIAPFLIVERIGFGPAFGATAALLYVPFAERTLVRMAYPNAG